MKCLETRPTKGGTRRRYECTGCGERYTTAEYMLGGSHQGLSVCNSAFKKGQREATSSVVKAMKTLINQLEKL